MRALGASERVMAIITSTEAPTSNSDPVLADRANSPGNSSDNSSSRGSDGDGVTNGFNLEIAGGVPLGDKVDGRVVFKVGQVFQNLSLLSGVFLLSPVDQPPKTHMSRLIKRLQIHFFGVVCVLEGIFYPAQVFFFFRFFF